MYLAAGARWRCSSPGSTSRTRSRAWWRSSRSSSSSPSSPATASPGARSSPRRAIVAPGGGRLRGRRREGPVDRRRDERPVDAGSSVTADVVREPPIFGVGLGAQPEASQDLAEQNGARTGALRLAHDAADRRGRARDRRARALRSPARCRRSHGRCSCAATTRRLALSLGAVLLALFVHSLSYSGFFEDPITWLALGIGAAYSRSPRPLASARPRRARRTGSRGRARPQHLTGARPGPCSACWACSSPSPCRSSARIPGRSTRPAVEPHGMLGPLVRAADDEWDLGVLRAAAMLAGRARGAVAAVVVLSARTVRPAGSSRRSAPSVIALLAVPATLLQVGLRDATAPWYHVNDSTYQIELAGELVLDGETPYGHDYRGSGLERFYAAVDADEDVPRGRARPLRLLPRHGADRRRRGACVPAPFDDYRRLRPALHARLSSRAALLFHAPLPWKLAAGAALAANPLATRARLVRDRGRAEPAADWCSPSPSSPAPATSLAAACARRRRPAEAVRARRGAVPRRDAPRASRAAAGRSTEPPASSPRSSSPASSRSRSPTPARSGTTRSPTARGTYRIIGYGLAGAAGQARRARRPLRLVPVPAARAARLAAR